VVTGPSDLGARVQAPRVRQTTVANVRDTLVMKIRVAESTHACA
jgi:hypothetical protein